MVPRSAAGRVETLINVIYKSGGQSASAPWKRSMATSNRTKRLVQSRRPTQMLESVSAPPKRLVMVTNPPPPRIAWKDKAKRC